MLRRFLLGTLVMCLASMAWAGVPDLIASTASVDAGSEGASVYVLPSGEGVSFDEAFAPGGAVVDATITLELIDTDGNFMFLYPFDDLWIESTGTDQMVPCPGNIVADAATDEFGQTTWTNPPSAGGNSLGEQVVVLVAGAPLASTVNVIFNSADINGDLTVDLSDIVRFTQTLGEYSYEGDFNYDEVINLSDIVRFTPGIGTICN